MPAWPLVEQEASPRVLGQDMVTSRGQEVGVMLGRHRQSWGNYQTRFSFMRQGEAQLINQGISTSVSTF